MKNDAVPEELPTLDEIKLMQSVTCIQKMAPTWSGERIWSYLRYSKNLPVSKKSIIEVLRKLARGKNKTSSADQSPQKTLQKFSKGLLWQMNMFSYKAGGWAEFKIIFVMDTSSGAVKGHTFAASCRAWHWLFALNQALEKGLFFDEELCLVTGKTHQSSSPTFMKACWDLGIQHQITKEPIPGEAFAILFRRWISEKLPSYLNHGSFPAALDQCVYDFNSKVAWEGSLPHDLA